MALRAEAPVALEEIPHSHLGWFELCFRQLLTEERPREAGA